MALPSLSFVAGLAILAYLASFILFALLRIITGISIQRIGYSGLRRITFTPKEGIRIDLRGLGLTLHRPTFSQPTWLSIVLTELKITIDLKNLGGKAHRRAKWAKWAHGESSSESVAGSKPENGSLPEHHGAPHGEHGNVPRSRTWEQLTDLKERVKRLHRKIQWIRLVDLVATNTSLVLVDVGTVQVASFTMAVDTRRKTVDRSRLFRHRKAKSKDKRPAEWIMTVRSILFTPEGKDSSEMLDHCQLNIHGLLYKDLDGLRDTSISIKLGRVSVPYDDLQTSFERIKKCREAFRKKEAKGASDTELSVTDIAEELDRPGSREESIVRSVSDSKEFVSSILRGIKEIQIAISFFGLSKKIRGVQPSGSPVYVNMSLKEFGLDVLRLDPKSPAHRMYFSPHDIAHQALIAAISISVGIDDGRDQQPERLLYVPMATATVRTTLPSKTIQYSTDKNVEERNANILFANLVVTSPSIDIAPKHLPLVLAMLQNRQGRRPPSLQPEFKRSLVSRLLPKASIKISIHEPVIRVQLPPMEADNHGPDDFDLLISSMSSISLDVESSHSAEGELHYALSSSFRVSSHHLYYQTASSVKHDLLMTDSGELRLQLDASPNIIVAATGNFQTFSIYMVRPEISEGLRQIVAQLHNHHAPKQRYSPVVRKLSFLRRLPTWLQHVQLQGADFNFEVAGEDAEVSPHPKGCSLHVESWTAEYKAHKGDEPDPRAIRRRAPSRTIHREDLLRPRSPGSSRSRSVGATDGRRLAFHVQGLEGFVIESAESWEPESFLSLPRFEVAFSTSTDNQGPLFHTSSEVKALYIQYSLYRHFAIAVATKILRNTFSPPAKPVAVEIRQPSTSRHLSVPSLQIEDFSSLPAGKQEITTYDVKVSFVQLKAAMPSDPPLMLHVHELEAGRHRWSNPFAKARLLRLYAETPGIRRIWSRVVSVKGLRLDHRQAKRKQNAGYVEERSVDVVADAIRLAVPHQLVVHKIFDNITNVTKTVQQLHHRFRTNSNEDILEKRPEGPKHVPKVSFRSQALLFEVEDGLFEWKLGTIYRVGLVEQKQRLAREEAFRLKVKRLKEQDQRGSSWNRARSAHQPRGRSKRRDEKKGRSKSAHEHSDRERPKSSRSDRKVHYDTEGMSALSDAARISIEQAKYKLGRLNAQSWKKRIDHAMNFQNHATRDMRSIFWGLDEMPDDVEQKETILAMPQRPALMAILISDVNVLIDKPSFALTETAKFLHRVGKGMPLDMKYSLLIPMHLQISMGEARISLRDYPLPFLHVPAIRPGQSPRLPSFSMATDFVIAEEFRDLESTRQVEVVVVPREKLPNGEERGGLVANVRRTVSPVKTYSDMNVEINTSYPTRITWGTSYQPAIQDTMQVIENFTKPAVDPSERVGFWDKIRLTFHSRINVAWKGDGDVHLILKGSRDPYMVTGQGAGFVMCWRNDVRWGISQYEDPRKFMTVDSGAYVLAIPDFAHYARQTMESESWDDDNASSTASYKQGAVFKKTIMKLSGNVQWLAGLVFERNVDEAGRSFDFIPHYQVVLKHPNYAKSVDGKKYDAFKGFRSHHIHMSVAIAAPVDRDWSVTNLKPSSNYNSVHLTPRFFSHFFSWWSTFSGAMALPVRQGKLWPGVEKSSKKFGRHLATIKYNLLLSPLYMSHMYKHKDSEDYGQGIISATGLKIRLDSFMLDLHQRREEFMTMIQGMNRTVKSTGMRINEAQLDFISADIRAVSASIHGANMNDLDAVTDEMLALYNQERPSVDLGRFTIPDNDLSWVDMDDFVELDFILPSESNPETKILPLAFAPRFSYFRQTDHQDVVSGDTTRFSSFGHEPTHFCVMSARNDPRRVQCDLIQERLKRIVEQMSHNKRAIGEQELKILRDADGDTSLEERLEVLKNHNETLQKKYDFLQSMFNNLMKRLETGDRLTGPDLEDEDDLFFDTREGYDSSDPELDGADSTPLADYISDFNNRFIVHNMQLKWSNSLRNIILRYIHQVSQRRGFVYYMSRRAVKFILDIVEEQKKSKETEAVPQDNLSAMSSPLLPPDDDELSIQDRVQQLLEDGKKFVQADDPAEDEGEKPSADNVGEDIARDFTPQNTYHVRLIAPQIQLQSEKNTKAAVLVTAKGMQLKMVQIMDKDRVTDEVSGLVQRRFSAAMDSLQIFVTSSQTFSTDLLHMYSGNRYGAPAGSSWPPWVPIEIMFEFEINPYGFSRVVQRTSASMRFDKYNTLRLKYNDDVTGGEEANTQYPDGVENRMDHIWIDFPMLRAICDSGQYYAMYIIVLDLLLYNEPLEKTRSERLEKIMLASDFSDLTGAPEMVTMLQQRIRQLEEIKLRFQVNEKYLDREGWRDRIAMEQDLATCEDELFFMMKAITTAQRKGEDRTQAPQANGLLHWYIAAKDIVWHLVRENNESLAEFQLKNALYDRTDNSDGSNLNSMEIERIHGLNLLPNALYPEMIAPYHDATRVVAESRDTKMLRVHWYMLEAIAGIPVMDHFEVNLIPLKVQLEYEVGKKFFEYIFPNINSGGSDGFSPFIVKQRLPPQLEEGEEESGISYGKSGRNTPDSFSALSADPTRDAVAGAGTLELRLQPTLTLPDVQRPRSPGKTKTHLSHTDHHLKLFSKDKDKSDMRKALYSQHRERSFDTLTIDSRPSSYRAPSNFSLSSRSGEGKKFTISRSSSSEKKGKKEGPSDDLTEMMSRASSYMTLAYVKIPSMVLCLSYKGKGQRDILDVHDLVFRLPTLEYRNKTWSNLDLVNQVKKDVIRTLISHTGAIIGNKFSHHRPSRQQSKLRQLANSSILLAASSDTSADTPSIREESPIPGDDASSSEPRRSFTSGRSHPESYPSSIHSTTGTAWTGGTAASGKSGASEMGDASAPELLYHGDAHLEYPDTDRSTIKSTFSQLRPKSSHSMHSHFNADDVAEDSEESRRRKGRLLLGKRFLRAVPRNE